MLYVEERWKVSCALDIIVYVIAWKKILISMEKKEQACTWQYIRWYSIITISKDLARLWNATQCLSLLFKLHGIWSVDSQEK